MKRLIGLFDGDPALNEVILNGCRHLIQKAQGKPLSVRRQDWFADQASMSLWIQAFAYDQGVRLDPYCPSGGGYFGESGTDLHFRWHAVLPPVAAGGPVVCLRRQNLMHSDRVPSHQGLPAGFIDGPLHLHPTIIFGPAGAGKTTCLLRLLRHLDDERLMIVDSQVEFRIDRPNWFVFSPRPADREGRGGYPISEIEKDLLRLGPDRFVVAELRGNEAGVFISALTNGHRPPLCTLHASSARQVLQRLTALAAQSGVPASLCREVLKQPLNLIEMQARPLPHIHRVETYQPYDGD